MNPTIQAIDAIILYLEATKAKGRGIQIDDSVQWAFAAMMMQKLDELLMFCQLYRKVTPHDI